MFHQGQDSILFLKQEIEKLNAEIAEIIKQNPALKNNEQLICSIPGAGKITAAILLADLSELGTLDHKKIAALVGLLPSIAIVVIIVTNDA